MNGLHTAAAPPQCGECLRAAETGRLRHARGQHLARHGHAHAFAAVVLSGRYVEAGDSGLHRVAPGDVLFHCAHEHHVDRVCNSGADVLVLPLPDAWSGAPRAYIADVDTLARLAERDVPAAVACMLDAALPTMHSPGDWPEQLAAALLHDPGLSLAHWAQAQGLHPGSVSRGFRQVFDVSPKAFRLQARTHAALKLYRGSALSAVAIAQACGFADQAHLGRSVSALTGHPASRLRHMRTATREAAPPARGRGVASRRS